MNDDRNIITQVIAKQPPHEPHAGLRCAHRILLLAQRQEQVSIDLWANRDRNDDELERGLFARVQMMKDFREQCQRDFVDGVAKEFGWPLKLEAVPQ